jgi:hypothetical protein
MRMDYLRILTLVLETNPGEMLENLAGPAELHPAQDAIIDGRKGAKAVSGSVAYGFG